MKPIRASGIFLACVALASCTQPGETTGVSAATGGAIGAGLGAIVGGATGAAGAGLAIGAVSGAATGALIGNALEAREKATHNEDEAIQRQQQMLAAHGRQLEELKRAQDSGSGAHYDKTLGMYVNGPSNSRASVSSDTTTVASAGFGSRTASNNSMPTISSTSPTSGIAYGAAIGYSYPGSTMRLDSTNKDRLARGDVITTLSASKPQLETRGSYAPPLPPAHVAVARAAIAPKVASVTRPTTPSFVAPAAAVVIPPPVTPKKRVLATKTDSSGLVERDLALPENPPADTSVKNPVNEVIPQAPTDSEVAAVAVIPVEKAAVNTDSVPVQPSESVARVSEKSAEIAPQSSDECKQAGDEVSKAGGSSEVADKLFHYRRALRLCPDNARYHLGLGQVYVSLNRKMDAEFEFREALRLKPDMTEAKQSLDSVRY